MTQFRSQPEEPKKEDPGARAVIEKHADALDEVLEKSKPKAEAKKEKPKAEKPEPKKEEKEPRPVHRPRLSVLRDLVESIEDDPGSISDDARYEFQALNRRLTRALAS